MDKLFVNVVVQGLLFPTAGLRKLCGGGGTVKPVNSVRFLRREGGGGRSLGQDWRAPTHLKNTQNGRLAVCRVLSRLPPAALGRLFPHGGFVEVIISQQSVVEHVLRLSFSARRPDPHTVCTRGGVNGPKGFVDARKLKKDTHTSSVQAVFFFSCQPSTVFFQGFTREPSRFGGALAAPPPPLLVVTLLLCTPVLWRDRCNGLKNGKRNKFFVSEDCHPQTIALVQTRGSAINLDIVVSSSSSSSSCANSSDKSRIGTRRMRTRKSCCKDIPLNFYYVSVVSSACSL